MNGRFSYLNAGDEIGVVRYNRSYGGFVSSQFGTVTKVNGHGHIFVNVGKDEDLRFTKNGEQYRNERFGVSLVDPDRLRTELAVEQTRRNRASIVREIESTLKSGWSYSGTWHPSEERIDALKDLVAKLEESAKES